MSVHFRPLGVDIWIDKWNKHDIKRAYCEQKSKICRYEKLMLNIGHHRKITTPLDGWIEGHYEKKSGF